MKTILLFSILFCVIAMPAISELTVEDIEKIDAKIKESETRIKEYIDTKNESIDKRLSLVTTLIGGLIALIVLAVSIPQILMAWRGRKDRTQEKQIEELTREFETLKQQGAFSRGIET